MKNIINRLSSLIFDKKRSGKGEPKIVEIGVGQIPAADTAFKAEFDKVLELCELDEETILGILFFLGAFIPSRVGSNLFEIDTKRALSVFSLYSKSTGDFSDYGELNDAPFHDWIYNVNFLFNKATGNEKPVIDFLRKVKMPSGKELVIGESQLNKEFLERFDNENLNLNFCQNVLDFFFMNIGKELKSKEFDRSRAYEAGFAYRMMQMQMDIKGTEYLITSIAKCFTPLYKSIFYLPELYVFNNDAFKANHLFSHILNNLYGGPKSPLFEFAQAIHRFHQFVFYKPDTIEIRDQWSFASKTDAGSGMSVFLNAAHIKTVKFDKNYSSVVKASGEVFDKTIIDRTMGKGELLDVVLNVILSKYGINGRYEFTPAGAKSNDWLDGGRWNHKGEYIQFLVLMWYETCLHSLAVNELTQ